VLAVSRPRQQAKPSIGTNHWDVDGIGILTGAWATEGDKLVLSDLDCGDKKDDEKK
jgi:hypothetical protein